MSTPPNVLSAHAPSSRACGGFVRSHVFATAVPFARSISATTCSSGSLRRPATATRAPSAASMSAVARPMPVPAPVTSAILPSSVFMGSSRRDATCLGARQARGLGAGALDLVDGLGCAGREDLPARGGDQHVVLDAHADAAELLRHGMRHLRGLGLLLFLELLGGGDA